MNAPEAPHCVICRDLDPGNFAVQKNIKWDRPKSTIAWSDLASPRNTCPGCGLLFAVLSQFYGEPRLQTLQTVEISHHHSISLRLDTRDSEELILYSLIPSPWKSIQVRNHIHGSTNSGYSLEWAKNAISLCTKNHKACQPVNLSGQNGIGESLPKRLLDLGSGFTNNFEGPIKLYETQANDRCKPIEYACLSHSWGTELPLVTSSANIKHHLEEIVFASLPKTFQDAVNFTRRLGIRYLWIDSLCIIQDDAADWREESMQMDKIYNNCVVCIAATLSTDPTSGCYSQKPLSIARFVSREPRQWEIFARKTLNHGSLSDPTGFRMPNPNQRNPLLSRGWVFQERLLAPRYLHFVEQELALECNENFVCECACSCDRTRTGPSKAEIVAALKSGDHQVIESLWRDLATKYSGLSLKYATDRFPAIAGLASLFQTARGSHCLAGIWESSALEDLAWAVWSPGGFNIPPGRIEGERASPSWSWATLDAPILYSHFGARQIKPLCEVLQLGRKWDYNIDGAEVLRPGVMWYSIDRTDPEEARFAQLAISGKLVPVVITYEGLGTFCKLKHPNLSVASWFSSDFAFGKSGEHQIPSGSGLMCLSLFKDEAQITSLVLKMRDKTTELYERVGLYTQSISDIDSGKQRDIFDGMSGRRRVFII